MTQIAYPTLAARQRTGEQRVSEIMSEVRALPAEKRLERLRVELDSALAERQLLLLESLRFSSGSEVDRAREDDEDWDEVGVGGWPSGGRGLRSNPALRTLEDLRRARDVARDLACENEFAIGAHERLVDYVAGSGLTWTAVPKDINAESKDLTRKMADTIKRIREQESWGLLEGELVLREDRDGEQLLRLYPNANAPARLRFVEPEHVLPPVGQEHPFGIEMLDGDPVAYWILEGSNRQPTRVDRIHRGLDVRADGQGIPAIIHSKLNVDANSPRGWPTFYPIRRNLARAEKLLRNMSYVAALQAAIALIKKYDNATQSQVQGMIDAAADATGTNRRTGRETNYVEAQPGTVWHAPKGQSYEAPISSVNAANNVEVLQADLRACSVRTGFPEYMFSGRGDKSYSSELVKESPFVKKIEGRQARDYVPLRAGMEASLIHEEFMGRLPRGACAAYDLMAEFPNPVVRDVLQDRQGKQILVSMGVMSRKTLRATEGLDDTTEERNIDAENARGYVDLRQGGVGPGKPPPGSTEGGPGGLDHKPGEPGQPGRPEGSKAGEGTGASAAPAQVDGKGPAAQANPPAPAPGAETVQDTALNGAQVQALQGVVQAVAAKQLPAAAAVEMLVIAFPSIGRERALIMVNAAAAFDVKEEEPKGGPPAPAHGVDVAREQRGEGQAGPDGRAPE